MIKSIILALLLVSPAQAVDLSTTPLGIAAAALQVGQAAKFETPGYQVLPWRADSFYYGDGAVWDSAEQQIQFIASPVGGTPRYRYTYDAATDAWATELMPWQTSGHGYDSNALNDAGLHCFARYGSQVGCRQADGSWVDLPALPWAPGTVQALEYLPGAGMVIVSRQGSIAVWNGAAWVNVPGAAGWGNTGTWITTVGNVAYLGSGLFVYRLDANLTLTRMPDPPWSMGNNQAYHSTDGTKLLVARTGGAEWLEFDGAAWVSRPDLVSGAIKPSHHYHQAFIPELGVIVTMSARTPTLHDVWLVKVANGTTPVEPPPAPTCVPQSAIPPLFWGLPLCSAEAVKRDVCDQPGVFACDRFEGEPLTGSIVRASSKLTTPWVADGVLNMAVVSMGGKDTGHYRVRMPSIAEGGLLAFTYRKRLDAEAMKHNGSKDWIVWGPHWAPSCTTQQVVITHMYSAQVPIAYRSCGLGITSKLSDGDHVWQGGDFDCRYRDARAGRLAKCHTKAANEWATYYTEIRVGHYGQPDSNITMHVKTADGWRKMMDFPFMLPSNVPLEQIMLTGYMTNETIFEHPGGRIAFDDFIASTQPIDMALL